MPSLSPIYMYSYNTNMHRSYVRTLTHSLTHSQTHLYSLTVTHSLTHRLTHSLTALICFVLAPETHCLFERRPIKVPSRALHARIDLGQVKSEEVKESSQEGKSRMSNATHTDTNSHNAGARGAAQPATRAPPRIRGRRGVHAPISLFVISWHRL